jgi:hypothetical protein
LKVDGIVGPATAAALHLQLASVGDLLSTAKSQTD